MTSNLFETINTMTSKERMALMAQRRSVRRYLADPIDPEKLAVLNATIDRCNQLGQLNLTIRLDEPDPFDHWLAHYGSLSGIRHYIALIGQKHSDLQERIGYFGEFVVLQATALGLGTCWIAGTYDKHKSHVKLSQSEELVGVIAVGNAAHPGTPRKTKSIAQLSRYPDPIPEWFNQGMKASQLAPTAMNQQNFRFITDGSTVSAQAGIGFYTKLDLGIAKLHFELGTGMTCFGYPLLDLPALSDRNQST